MYHDINITTLHAALDAGLDPDEVRDWLDLWEDEQAAKEAAGAEAEATICSAEPLTPEVAQWIWVDLFLLLCSGHFDGRTPAEMDNARFLSRALDYFKAVEDGAVVPEAEDWW